MSREVHVRICEGVGVKFPHATRLMPLGLLKDILIIISYLLSPEISSLLPGPTLCPSSFPYFFPFLQLL